jgi:hypothetical protein
LARARRQQPEALRTRTHLLDRDPAAPLSVIGAVAVPPAAGAGAFAVASLGALIAFVVAWGLAHGWAATFGYLFSRIANWTIHVAHFSVTPFHALGQVDTYVRRQLDQFQAMSEHAMVYTFGKAIELTQWTAYTIEKLAADTWHGIEHRTATATHTVTNTITHKVLKPVVQKITAASGITAAMYRTLTHRVSALAAHVAHIAATIPHDIALAPTRVGITSKALRRLARRTTALERATIGLGAVALVTAALGRMGLGWLRCPSLLRMGRRLGCVGFGWIEAFFATTFEALVVLDLCKFALAAQQLARLIVPHLAGTLLVQNAVCLGGGSRLPSAHDSPKTLTRVTLPSAHD